MGIKFSELPQISTEQVDEGDCIALLDTSEGVMKRATVLHVSKTTAYGGGTESYYGHVKVNDDFEQYVGDAANSVAASQYANYLSHSQAIELCVPSWVGTYAQWQALSEETKNKYIIVNLTDR